MIVFFKKGEREKLSVDHMQLIIDKLSFSSNMYL